MRVWWSVLALLCGAGLARAGDRDLVLSRLAEIAPDSSGVIASDADFRALASELGVILAPPLGPADSLGSAGFLFSFDAAFTGIASSAAHWRVLESSRRPDLPESDHGDSLMPSLRLLARKGLGFPLPSTEFSIGAIHIPSSSMWAAQSSLKVAIVEGSQTAMPAIALRAGLSQLFGNSQLGLSVGSADLSVSKKFGVADTVRLLPYLGLNTLFIKPRSQVIDKTPEVDALLEPDDARFQFKFQNPGWLLRHRAFVGAELKYSLLAFMVQASFALAGSGDDNAQNQFAVNTGLGLQF